MKRVKNFASVFGGKIDSIQWFMFWGKQNGNGECEKTYAPSSRRFQNAAGVVRMSPEECWNDAATVEL
ncbi:hypothetical protein DEO72_LG2g4361 [Vigna unguiculata]|uniref:Uncharacterized protein n=1 Tax=Vigna unguiculata TaxID=3917 RepID=A0A4D6L678_VIGUN|nr:hypothetical protein DEO72_LG2g4361 [Vigna unguiculata]